MEFGEHSIELGCMGKHSTVWADPQLLEIALFQLLDNAIKYSTPGSPIVIDLHEEEAEILISVRNRGSFIPPEERSRIFERFYRSPGSDRKVSGTGIGLAVVRRIMEAHQGRTWVNSDENEGTEFFVALPRIAREVGLETSKQSPHR
jgi:two-component system sensor histidine kinase KdpD